LSKQKLEIMKTLKELKDYASTTDNVWLRHKLNELELEIATKVHNERMNVYDTCINMI